MQERGITFLKARNNSIFVLLFLVFLCFFSIKLWYQRYELIKYLENFNLYFFNSFISIENKNSIKFNRLINYICLALPIISIYSLEIVNSFRKGRFDLNSTSFGRLKFSIGYKFADFWYFFLQNLVNKFPIIISIFTFGFTYFYGNLISWQSSFSTNLNHNSVTGVFFAVLSILFLDFAMYYSHKLQHEIPLIWNFHEFHHSATEMTVLSNSRICSLQSITNIIVFPFYMFSAFLIAEFLKEASFIPFLTLILFRSYDFLHQSLQHSSLKVIYPKYISWLIMSPSLHWIHHSDNPEHYDKNFGVIFPFWDKIFGTYLDESHIRNISSFGVKDTLYNRVHPLKAYFIVPIILLFRHFKKA